MIIDLRAIPKDGSRDYEFSLGKDWWKGDGLNQQVLGLDSPLKVRIKIYKATDKYILEGKLEGSLQMICDRCLNGYQKKIQTSYRIFLALEPADGSNSEVELLEEDMEIVFSRSEEIDLGDIIQEQLYLSLPIKSLCRDDCLGLCPECGNNLNDGICLCKRESGHPEFAKLKSLKTEGG